MEFLVLWLILAGIVSGMARNRHRSQIGFFLLSLVLSPLIGLLVLLFTKGDPLADGTLRKCPSCAEFIKTEATVCRFCQRELPRIPTVVERATTHG